jgi:hypothetical protein
MEKVNPHPFIILIEDSFHVVVDNKVLRNFELGFGRIVKPIFFLLRFEYRK